MKTITFPGDNRRKAGQWEDRHFLVALSAVAKFFLGKLFSLPPQAEIPDAANHAGGLISAG